MQLKSQLIKSSITSVGKVCSPDKLMAIVKFLTSFFSIRKLRIGVSVSGTVQDKLTVS